ncbi:hypothetical protein H4219_006475, partial [Mycoemilia scoparia]
LVDTGHYCNTSTPTIPAQRTHLYTFSKEILAPPQQHSGISPNYAPKWLSRLDYILAPFNLACNAHTNYTTLAHQGISDHKSIHCTISLTLDACRQFTRQGYRAPPKAFTDRRHRKQIQAILSKHLLLMKDCSNTGPFLPFLDALRAILTYLKKHDHAADLARKKEFNRLFKDRLKLQDQLNHYLDTTQNNQDYPSQLSFTIHGKASDPNTNPLTQLYLLDRNISGLLTTAGKQTRQAAATKWLTYGDKPNPWTTAKIQAATKPRFSKKITALWTVNQGSNTRVTSQDELSEVAASFYEQLYAPTSPPPSAIEHLLHIFNNRPVVLSENLD